MRRPACRPIVSFRPFGYAVARAFKNVALLTRLFAMTPSPREIAHAATPRGANGCPYQKVDRVVDEHSASKCDASRDVKSLCWLAHTDVVAHVVLARAERRQRSEVAMVAPDGWCAWQRGRACRLAGRAGRDACSGRASLVPMMKATDLRDRHDVAVSGRRHRTRNRRVFVQR